MDFSLSFDLVDDQIVNPLIDGIEKPVVDEKYTKEMFVSTPVLHDKYLWWIYNISILNLYKNIHDLFLYL